MNEAKQPRYYPRKMRVGWCVAHTVAVMGVSIERYGQRAATYPEACRLAEAMNKQPIGNGHNDTTT